MFCGYQHYEVFQTAHPPSKLWQQGSFWSFVTDINGYKTNPQPTLLLSQQSSVWMLSKQQNKQNKTVTLKRKQKPFYRTNICNEMVFPGTWKSLPDLEQEYCLAKQKETQQIYPQQLGNHIEQASFCESDPRATEDS